MQFDEAIDTFIELDLNPAKVVALYPETVSGRLMVPQERWISLYGGSPTVKDHSPTSSSESVPVGDKTSRDRLGLDSLEAKASSTGSIRGTFKTGLGTLVPSGAKEIDSSSISSTLKVGTHGGYFPRRH